MYVKINKFRSKTTKNNQKYENFDCFCSKITKNRKILEKGAQMTPDKQFAYMKRTILDKVSSWDDMYVMFDELVARAKHHPSFLTASNAMFLMYAFLTAMKEAPEEGDIKKLMESAIRILVYEGESKLGVSFTIVTEEEFYAEVGKQLAETVVGVSMDVAIAQAQAEKPKGPLH